MGLEKSLKSRLNRQERSECDLLSVDLEVSLIISYNIIYIVVQRTRKKGREIRRATIKSDWLRVARRVQAVRGVPFFNLMLAAAYMVYRTELGPCSECKKLIRSARRWCDVPGSIRQVPIMAGGVADIYIERYRRVGRTKKKGVVFIRWRRHGERESERKRRVVAL